MADERWAGMSWERLRAAKALLDLGLFRDSISRSQYAAYCAATSVVVGRGVTFAFGRQNPSHEQLPDLVLNVAGVSVTGRRQVRRLLRYLRHAREDAEYRPYAAIPRDVVLTCIHNAVAVQTLLEVGDGNDQTAGR